MPRLNSVNFASFLGCFFIIILTLQDDRTVKNIHKSAEFFRIGHNCDNGLQLRFIAQKIPYEIPRLAVYVASRRNAAQKSFFVIKVGKSRIFHSFLT